MPAALLLIDFTIYEPTATPRHAAYSENAGLHSARGSRLFTRDRGGGCRGAAGRRGREGERARGRAEDSRPDSTTRHSFRRGFASEASSLAEFPWVGLP
jgi:hypothetical protein